MHPFDFSGMHGEITYINAKSLYLHMHVWGYEEWPVHWPGAWCPSSKYIYINVWCMGDFNRIS